MRYFSYRRTHNGYIVINERRLQGFSDGEVEKLTHQQWLACHTHVNSRRIADIISISLENDKIPTFKKVSPFTRILLLKKCLRICDNQELFEAIRFQINILISKKRRGNHK